MMKYKIMIIRSKISYIACLNMMTIKELIARQIRHSFNLFMHEGLIQVPKVERKIDDEIY